MLIFFRIFVQDLKLEIMIERIQTEDDIINSLLDDTFYFTYLKVDGKLITDQEVIKNILIKENE